MLLKVMSRSRVVLLALTCSALGVLAGAYLFSRSERRSFLAIVPCERCTSSNELIGLLASVGIQRFPGLLPETVLETDKTIVIRHPRPAARIHYVIIPKKDIKNIGGLSSSDMPYLIDAHTAARVLIGRDHMNAYRLITNGPGYQTATYLHFHLTSQ